MDQRRKEDCLYYYFKALRELGEDAKFAKKTDLYKVAGDRVYWDATTAGKRIRELLKCPAVVKRVSQRVDDEII